MGTTRCEPGRMPQPIPTTPRDLPTYPGSDSPEFSHPHIVELTTGRQAGALRLALVEDTRPRRETSGQAHERQSEPQGTHVRKFVVWGPTNAHRNGARTGTGWDRTGWSWDGHRVPARRLCAPREPADTAPTCASSAMRRSPFRRIRDHGSPGCSGRRDGRRGSRGPVREVSELAGSQTGRPTLLQKIAC